MPIRGIDHVALTCADPEATLEFYERVLGAESLFEALWRAGEIPVVLLQIGGSRLSIHAAVSPAEPRARVPMPGSADLCFRFEGSIVEAERMLLDHDVEIELGPVDRPAADGKLGQSIYFRDPDGNLLELLSTDS